jgi:hypothetical protein
VLRLQARCLELVLQLQAAAQLVAHARLRTEHLGARLLHLVRHLLVALVQQRRLAAQALHHRLHARVLVALLVHLQPDDAVPQPLALLHPVHVS